MRIALAGMSQEACTFNPTPTTLASFRARCLVYGRDVADSPPASAGKVLGFVDTIRGLVPDVELVPSVAARTTPGGRIARDALEHFRDVIVETLTEAGPLDGFALCLHGASAAEDEDDPEGYLLAAAREVVGDDVPIGVSLDHHANITERMVEHASFLIGDRTQPHDNEDTGRLLAELLVNVVRGEVDPVMVWRKLPLIAHQEQYLTIRPPMKTWFDRARAFEVDDTPIVSASTFPMQPWLDVAGAGFAVVVVADASAPQARAAADSAADELADLVWQLRESIQRRDSLAPDQAIAAAADIDGFVTMSDTGDSVFGGAGGDSTTLLVRLIADGRRRSLVPVVVPDLADQVGRRVQRGVGALAPGSELVLRVGGGVTGWWEPIEVTGTVVAAVEDYRVPQPDPLYHSSLDFGATVALDLGAVMLFVSERSGMAGNHPAQYQGLGIDIDTYDLAVLKTASNFQHWAEDLTTNVVRADTPGPTQSDVAGLPWTRIPRPTYPLDPDLADWR